MKKQEWNEQWDTHLTQHTKTKTYVKNVFNPDITCIEWFFANVLTSFAKNTLCKI